MKKWTVILKRAVGGNTIKVGQVVFNGIEATDSVMAVEFAEQMLTASIGWSLYAVFEEQPV